MAADPMLPFHVEAYPTLDLREALRELRAGRSLVVWRDQQDSLVGIAMLALDARNVLSVDAVFRKHPYIGRGEYKHEIACSIVLHRSGHDDMVAASLETGERSRVMVFAEGAWRSRDCQRLGYRCRIVSASVRATERLAELDRQLAAGQPRYMRVAAHAVLIREQAELRLLLGDRRPAPPAHQQPVLTRSWTVQPRPELEITRLPPVPLGTMVEDVLELVGTRLFAGPTPQERAEAAIRAGVLPAYRALAIPGARVTALQVRRAMADAPRTDVPALGDDPYLLPVPAWQLPFQAVLMLSVEGDEQFFGNGFAQPGPERLPIGEVTFGELALEVAFSPDTAAFVPVLLQAELNLIAECLERQRRAAAQVTAAWPATVKRLVAERWPTLSRVRRPSGRT